MPEVVRAAFVAALEREVEPLVARWEKFQLGGDGTSFPAFRSRANYKSGEAVLCCAGTGVIRAETATSALLAAFAPEIVISIGFAGATAPELRAGDVVIPAQVLCAATGERIATAFGHGAIATLNEVAGCERKVRFWDRDRISAVEMEAAGAARASKQAGVRFSAIKAVSDELDDDTEFVAPFVRPEGFDTPGFLKYIGVRPKLWPAVARLKRNSELASSALCKVVEGYLSAPEEFRAAAIAAGRRESAGVHVV